MNAPPGAVWKALTDARELERWFPLEAGVVPGKGGSIRLSWGPPWDGEGRIEIWEPERHLRMLWPFHKPEEGEVPLAVDYELEGRGGTTRLRLVHSGFGADARFDDEFDGTRRGWHFELRSLKHYLERHRGEDRAVALAAIKIPLAPREAWQRLAGKKGLAASGTIEGLKEGARYEIVTASGDELRGTVVVSLPPTDFSGTVDDGNAALFRLGVEKLEGGREVWLWYAAYGPARSDVRAVKERWSALLRELFPEGTPVQRGLVRAGA